jgi:septum site-determining protein MinC
MPATIAAVEPILELKFGQVGIANLRLNVNDPDALRAEIEQKVAAAPALFGRAPVILDLSRLPQLPNAAEAQALLDAIRAAGMLPVALSYSTTENEVLAKELGLPLLAKFRAVYERKSDDGDANMAPAPAPSRPRTAPNAAPEPAPRTVAAPASMTGLQHTKAVRSGQQVYARGRDLIVNAAVGNGAEVIADGSIHIYGRLSGRALAGAQGDASARIYCMDFQAELVSIAGRYRVIEDLPKELRGKPVQAWLDGEKLLIEALVQ